MCSTRMGYADPVFVTVGDIIDKCKIYKITMAPADFKKNYRLFKRFSLIDYSDDIATEDGKVKLYPSLQFCMDIGQLKQVMAEYTADDDIEGEKDSMAGFETADMDSLETGMKVDMESEDEDEAE